MGFWGSFVLARSVTALGDLDAIRRRGDGLDGVARLGDGWQLGTYPGADLIEDGMEPVVRELVTETGSPALTGFVIDSDCIDLVGVAADGSEWRACLARAAMAGYLAEDGQRLDDVFLTPGAAVAAARQWAVGARLEPDGARLRTMFAADGVTADGVAAEDAAPDDAAPIVDGVFGGLVEALGVPVADTGTAGAGDTADPEPARRTGGRVAPSNPTDAFVRRIAPMMKDAGYRRDRRTFRLVNELGDQAVVMVRSHAPTFLLDAGVAHQPVWDEQRARLDGSADGFRPDTIGFGSWTHQWRSDTTDHLDPAVVRDEVLPLLRALLDRRVYVDVQRGCTSLRTQSSSWLPGWEQALLANLETRDVDPGLAAAAEQVGRSLDGHGFVRDGLDHVLTSVHGDELRIRLTPSATATAADGTFYLQVRLRSRYEVEWDDHLTRARPDETPWYGLWPTATSERLDAPEIAHDPGSLLVGVATPPWSLRGPEPEPREKALARVLEDAVSRWLPRLSHEVLLAAVRGTGSEKEVLALMGDGPSEELDRCVEWLEVPDHAHLSDREFLPWVRSRLADRADQSLARD